jgi:predicted nucleic acid-binding protein
LNQIIIDTSAIIAVVLNEPEKDNLIEITQDTELISPASVHWEVGNAFSAMFKRRRLNLKEAIKGYSEYQKIPIQLIDIDIEDALKISDKNNIYAYDAYLLSCSIKFKLPLLTLDSHLQEIALKNKVKILEV